MSTSLEDRVTQLVKDLGGPNSEDVMCVLRNMPGEAIEFLASAFDHEPDNERRALVVRAIWQFRDERAVPTLVGALRDHHAPVWKEALDGLVTIGGPHALGALENGRVIVEGWSDARARLGWIQEALEQVRERDAG